jgi:hypothetical protein
VLSYNFVVVTKTIEKVVDITDFSIKFDGIKDISEVKAILLPSKLTGERTAFGISVQDKPRSISLKIFDKSISDLEPLSEVFLPIPSDSDTVKSLDREINDFEFSSESTELERISGSVQMNIAWGENQHGYLPNESKRYAIFNKVKYLHFMIL